MTPPFVTDQDPDKFATPPDIANELSIGRDNTPSIDAAEASMGQESMTGRLYRAAEREFADPSQLVSRLTGAPINTQPMLPADEINKTWGPIGADGKQVKITDVPMKSAVASLVAEAKTNELRREGVLGRYAQNNSGLANFSVGMAGFVMDPLNDAAMFLPGIGEETAGAALAKAGVEGAVGKFGARAIVGATSGAVAQIPLSATKYLLGKQEASDYGIRDALNEVAYTAAGGAILHAGFGAVGDAWKARRPNMPEPPAPPSGEMSEESSKIFDANPAQKNNAMRSAVSQIVSGREVNVDPIFPGKNYTRSVADIVNEQKIVQEEPHSPAIPTDELKKDMEAVNNPEASKKEEELPPQNTVEKEFTNGGVSELGAINSDAQEFKRSLREKAIEKYKEFAPVHDENFDPRGINEVSDFNPGNHATTEALRDIAGKSGYRVIKKGSKSSGSGYYTLTKDLPDGEEDSFVVRISDHSNVKSKFGWDINVAPGVNTLDDVIDRLRFDANDSRALPQETRGSMQPSPATPVKVHNLSAEHQEWEAIFGKPEDQSSSSLGKIDKKIQGIFTDNPAEGLPKASSLSDEQFSALEEYAKRVEESATQNAKPVGKAKMSNPEAQKKADVMDNEIAQLEQSGVHKSEDLSAEELFTLSKTEENVKSSERLDDAAQQAIGCLSEIGIK